jgi:cysteinyl-tRNA synthetase
MPKATEYIPQMQDLIRKIIENGIGYVAGGSVYFNVNEWRKRDVYGKLFRIDFEQFRAGVRIDADEYEREQVSDFVLWKGRKENEPYWEFDIEGQNCDGRPGWHIECSAMEKVLLGLPFDIHTGGIDLKFPHHEDEIAQSKAGYGIEPTAYWCHNEFLEVEGEKMSKSKGNFFTLRSLLDKNIDPLDIRFAMLSSHYASTYNFTFDGIGAARKGRFRIQEYIYSLHNETEGNENVDIEELTNEVFAELANDLHTPKALGKLFTFINNNLPEKFNRQAKLELISFFTQINRIFDIWDIGARKDEKTEMPAELIEFAELRISAKKAKNFAEADRLRDEIKKAGYLIKDTKDSYIIEKI